MSRSYRRKQKREAFKKCHNIRKGGKVVECRMSNEERRMHEKSQKGIFSHTKRTLDHVVKKMKEVETMKDVEKAKENHCVKTEECVLQYEIRKPKCESSKQNTRNVALKRTVKSDITNVNENQCWLCDKMIASLVAKVQCQCSKLYHVECMGVTERNDILRNKSCVWTCCKCRECNYCDSLFCDFGIPIDVNMYEITRSAHNEDNVNQACDLSKSTHKENEQIDNIDSHSYNSCETHRLEIDCSNETNQPNVTKNKVPIKKQKGGYFLRSKETKRPTKTAKDTKKTERTEK